MTRRAPLLLILATLSAVAAEPIRCAGSIDRAAALTAAFAPSGWHLVRAEAGTLKKSASLKREVEAGEYLAFAVTDEGRVSKATLRVRDSKGVALLEEEGAHEVVIEKIPLEKKDTIEVALETNGESPYAIVLLGKRPRKGANELFEAAGARARELEAKDAIEVVVLDAIGKDPWQLKRHLEAGTWTVEAIGSEEISSLEVEIKPTGKKAGEKRAATTAEIKSAGEREIALAAKTPEGTKEGLAALLVTRR